MTLDQLYDWGEQVRERTTAVIADCELAISQATHIDNLNDALRAASGLLPQGKQLSGPRVPAAPHVRRFRSAATPNLTNDD